MQIPLYIQKRYQQFVVNRHPVASGRTRIRHQRLYIVPSIYGGGFALIALTLLIGALNYQLSLGFFFAFLLLGIAHAILLRTYANLLGLDIACGSAIAVFAGENVYFPITLYNEKKQQRYAIQIDCASCAEPSYCHIEGLNHTIVQLPLLTQQRGLLTLPRLRVYSSAPMGFFRCWTYLHFAQQALIYPHPESNPPPFPTHGTASKGKTMLSAGQEDFAGLREFQRGDALHDIAWKQSAKSEQLLIRQYQSPAGDTLWLSFAALSHLNLEAKLSRLCAWVLQAEGENRPYGLELPQLKIPPALGKDHLHRCLSALAEFK